MDAPNFSVEGSTPPGSTPQAAERPGLESVIRELTPRKANHTLRRAAIAADASTTTDIHLALLWRELSRGVSAVFDGFFTDERCYLVLALQEKPAPIEGRRLQILELVLGGSRQKNIAIDLDLAPSTVALNSRLALASMGLPDKPSRAHPLLMLAARASGVQSPQLPNSARCSVIRAEDGRELRVVAMQRPDFGLAQLLPGAELAVIRSLVEGLCYREIARQRGTSPRTIANQISAVFRRLRVSGRNELVQRLFIETASGQAVKASQASAPSPSPDPPSRPPGLAMRRSA